MIRDKSMANKIIKRDPFANLSEIVPLKTERSGN